MPTLLQTLRLRHKLAALGVIGVTMCLLPLVQLLRYQGLELQMAQDAQTTADPTLLAVSVQRGLLSHRDVAGLVLRGRAEVEPERRNRQVDVDVRISQLKLAVQRKGTVPANEEAQALHTDWQTLVQRVLARSVSGDASDAAHRLLIEQTLQVMDLVASLSPLLQDPNRQVASAAQAVATAHAALTAQRQSSLQQVVPSKQDPRALDAGLAQLASAQMALTQSLSLREQRLQQQLTLGLVALGALAVLALLLAASVLRAALTLERQAVRRTRGAMQDGQWTQQAASGGLMWRLLRRKTKTPAAADQPVQPKVERHDG